MTELISKRNQFVVQYLNFSTFSLSFKMSKSLSLSIFDKTFMNDVFIILEINHK